MQLFDGARELPTQHISIRVPWHDNGWNGTICRHPSKNASCVQLKSIGQKRNDAQEDALAGEIWNDLRKDQLPACLRERASFMAPYPMTIEVEHAYKNTFRSHDHFGTTRLDMPAYSANCIPFRWMLREAAGEIAQRLQLLYRPELEERIDALIKEFEPVWVQDRKNHLVMLDSFFSALKPRTSLCFFYAKATPLTEDPRRVVIGVGRVMKVGDPLEYEYIDTGNIRSMLWERAVHHSIRPEMTDGFLFPYQDVLARAEAASFGAPFEDIARLTALVPASHTEAFSYTSEHVSHDVAIEVLLECDRALAEISSVVPGAWASARGWIDERLNEIWKLRGPYPGLGSALTAFGIQHGTLLAFEIERELSEGNDPWQRVDSLFRNRESDKLGGWIEPVLAEAWAHLSAERRALLEMISRVDMSQGQAERFYRSAERQSAGIPCTDYELLANPYLLAERDWENADPVSVFSIDRALFSDPLVLERAPIEEPSKMSGPLDPRRIRGFSVELLERASESQGHTLLPSTSLREDLNALAVQPKCSVTEDIMPVVERHFEPLITKASMDDSTDAYQLSRLHEDGKLIRKRVEGRFTAPRLDVQEDWVAQLETILGPPPADDEEEARARTEKAAALEELANSRVSVLIGPAGTGKTTLLSVLTGLDRVKNGGILLLAPTGKARVQMEQRTKLRAQTIAQFLLRRQRFNPDTGLYRRADHERSEEAKTVIVDECSMLTEEQLAATLDALKGVDRLILVGDPRQLPPIGAGRPFVDIVTRIAPEDVQSRFPRVHPGYCELTIPRRQVKLGRRADSDDLLLASWFSGQDPGPGADAIWARLEKSLPSESLRLVSWENAEDLREKLVDVLVTELDLADESDLDNFNLKTGGSLHEGWIYFHQGREGADGAAKAADAWQILTPLRSSSPGTIDVNRFIKDQFRHEHLDLAYNRSGKIPRPLGPERIVYGDKVINVVNRRRYRVYPDDDALKYVANGEIGVVVGDWRRKGQPRPDKIRIEFSSQPGFGYTYLSSEFTDESAVPVELAYAITVHKSQGSEFGTTLLVLPNPCRLLSRELLYTAFTRQQQRLVVLHQGDLSELKRFASAGESETARRLTNLFKAPKPIATETGFLEEALIHRTVKGDLVRSKSEVIIANLLANRGIEYEYERKLMGEGGTFRYPDFTIEDEDTGRIVYWEHLGLMSDPIYRRRWEEKKTWYEQHKIRPLEGMDQQSAGVLITSEDDQRGGIDSVKVAETIDRVFG